MITSADVYAIAPELTGLDLSGLISDAYTEVIVSSWSSTARADRAAKYLVAHMATLAQSGRGALGGPIQHQSVGGVSQSFGVAPGAKTLQTTGYGQEYQRLVRLQFGGPFVA